MLYMAQLKCNYKNIGHICKHSILANITYHKKLLMHWFVMISTHLKKDCISPSALQLAIEQK